MRTQEIIERKRDGKALSDAEIRTFIDGVCRSTWADYQTSALVMAMFIRGLNSREQTSITRAMLESGTIMDLSDIDAPKADKHSTGGVGDKTSLLIAPLAAACGIAVPMVSGRALGHTGGTLDKLESIPGYNVKLSFARLKRIIGECGFALAGQTAKIAPADRKLYALRDATATVPYIPLIVASIMSKKLAEGLDALVLDVKTGSGAFIAKQKDSLSLAEALCKTGRSFGLKTCALITDMSQPLGEFVGNALEVYECVSILRGEASDGMRATVELSVELTGQMLMLCDPKLSKTEARAKVQNALDSGEALARLRQNIDLQGGDPRICDRPQLLLAKGIRQVPVEAQTAGYLAAIDTSAVGNTICEIGGGRARAEDKVDHAVGYRCLRRIGDRVERGDEIGVLYCRSARQAVLVGERLRRAHRISDTIHKGPKLIKTVV